MFRRFVVVLGFVLLAASVPGVPLTPEPVGSAGAQPPPVDPAECWFLLPLDRDVTVFVMSDGEMVHVVERSVDAGPWTVVDTVVGDEASVDDVAVPVGVVEYRVVSAELDATPVGVFGCEELVVGAALTQEDVGGAPRLGDGTIGAEGSTVVPAMITPDVPAPATDPMVPALLCGGEATAPPAMAVSPVLGPTGFTKVTIPVGAYLNFDVVSTKSNPSNGGNWIWEVRLFRINPDGTAGAQIGFTNAALPFYWNGQYQVLRQDRKLVNTTANETEFLIRTRAHTRVNIVSTNRASSRMQNLEIRQQSDDSVIDRPCDLPVIDQCGQNGGNLYLFEPVTHDGKIYSGCVHHQSCLANLPAFIGSVQQWTCENQDTLVDILTWVAVGGVVVMIGGVLVPVIPSIALSSLSTLSFMGSPALHTMALTGPNMVTVMAGASVIGLTIFAVDHLSESERDVVQGLIDDGYAVPVIEYDTTTTELTTVTPPIVHQMLSTMGYDYPEDPTEETVEAMASAAAFEFAMNQCVLSATTGFAGDVIGQLDPNDVVVPVGSNGTVVMVNGVRRHVCSLIPMYLPGGVGLSGKHSIAESTMHIREVLYDEPIPPSMLLPSNRPIYTGPQPPPLAWHRQHLFTRRQTAPEGVVRRWYLNLPHQCQDGNESFHCDEWPWWATDQGGPEHVGIKPQAHLRYIQAADNANGGTDLRQFYSACSVDPAGGMFLVFPLPAHQLASGWDPSGSLAPVASKAIGPSCLLP